MFWGAKKKDDDKEKQLKHMKAAFPSMRRPNNDDRLFELRFTVDNQYNTLRITIPDDFPQSRPVYQVLGPVSHQWLDGSKLVSGCRKLNEWNPKSSSLLEITEDILATLLATKGKSATDATSAPSPSALSSANASAQGYSLGNYPGNVNSATITGNPSSNPNLQSYGAQLAYAQQPSSYPNLTNSSTTASGTAIPTPAQQQSSLTISPVPLSTTLQRDDSLNSPMQMALPDIPTHFPELDKLTEVQLERLLKDSVALDAHIAVMDSVYAMESLRDMQRETNSQSASKNLVLGEEVAQLYEQAESLQAEIRSLNEQLNQIAQDVHREDTLAREKMLVDLKKLVSTLDDESDAIGEGLIRGTVDLPTFKRDYLEKRSKFYTLACRVELAASSAATTVSMTSSVKLPAPSSVQYAIPTHNGLGAMYR